MEEINVNSIVILLDTYTRHSVDTITYDAIAKHASVVSDIREISDVYYGSSFVFFDASVPSIVTPELLGHAVDTFKVKPFLVYQNDAVKDLLPSYVTSIKSGYRTIEWNLIYAVVNGDTAIMETYQKAGINQYDLASLFENLPEAYIEPINKLYHSYLSLGSQLHTLTKERVQLKGSIANYRSVATRTNSIIKELKGLYDEVVGENRVLAAMLSESYDKTFKGIFLDRPRVLYIKTLSHLSGIDSLIMVLYSVLTKQYKVSVKVVKLVDSANAVSLRYVPNVYFPLSDSYNTHDVLVNDFLLSLASFNLLMGQLMLNRSRLDFLIVHDMRGTLNPALDSSLYDLRLNEMSSDYATLVEYDNILSDYKKAPFYWNFAEVAEYTGTNALKLANNKTISAILDFLM